MITAIILAAGSGRRVNAGKNKLLLKANGEEVICHTLKKFINIDEIENILLVHSKMDEAYFLKIQQLSSKIKLCLGGNTRTLSVKNALKSCDKQTDIVLIHDGARPFVSVEIIKNCIDCCKKQGSAICAVASSDTLASMDMQGQINSYIDRTKTIQIQTPQAFKYSDILKAYSSIQVDEHYTDDSSVYLKYIAKPNYCEGGIFNRKITYLSDMQLFKERPLLKIGVGIDTHVFERNKPLVLGGVTIPYEFGLKAHSDGDVLLHAIMDSLLSACDLKDIGYHFPDTQAKYANISSTKLLQNTLQLLPEYYLYNISAVIICDKPKLQKYIDEIQASLATLLNIPKFKINISATTTEGTQPNCISVNASCLLEIINQGEK